MRFTVTKTVMSQVCKKDIDLEKFIKRNSVLKIAKWLKVFHGNYGNVKLNETNYFYPCKQCLDNEVPGCHDFTVLSKLYNGHVLYDPCNEYNSNNIKRNQNRLIESPSRKRPVNSLSQIDKKSFE